MLPYSYLGSCRYEHVFINAYPGRLHSIREINYFLENLDNLKNYLNDYFFSNPVLKTFINLTYGNVFNDYLKDKTFLFPNQLTNFLTSKFLFIEISSLKYATTKCGVIANSSLLKTYDKEFENDYCPTEIFNDNFFKFKKDDFNLVKKEVEKMLKILKLRTNVTKIFLIPHVNLLSKKTNGLIATRQEIDSLIDYLVSNFNIFEKVDIWGYGQIKNYFQEDILDSNYLNFNKIGNKLVYDYFANDFRKKEANKNLINLQSNLSEKQQNLIS